MCENCKINPIITVSNIDYCQRCFPKYFERKVVKTISKYKLIEKNDRIGIAVSGGKDSFTLLYLLSKLYKNRPDIKLVAIAIDEGISNYRNLTLLKKYCNENNIELQIYSYQEEFKNTLDDILKIKSPYKPCSICGTFRRYLLNKKSRELELTKLATGHNLDDEAQSIIINQFRNNTNRGIRLGPITGIIDDPKFVKRIKPLYFLTEKETATFAYLKKFPIEFSECPHSFEAFRSEVRDLLNSFEEKYPGTKHSIINSFLETLPILKNFHEQSEIKVCSICQEPCSQKICNTCKLLNELNIS